ncbi:MAG: protein adenylyltransferase SelO [Novosphingobium sp.]
MGWNFDHSLARDLAGFYAPWQAAVPPAPRMVVWNAALAAALGLPEADEEQYARWFSGAEELPGSQPLALAYAGHQFGTFNPQLGDGRALLLGEQIAPDGARWDLQLKGSGPTPFSRQADGKSALGPALREYLVSEAMAALGVPSTRSLCVVATGEGVWRETPHPAAVLTRAAASHLRVGTFEWAAAHHGLDAVQRLTGYALARHFPDRIGAANPALALLEAVTDAQAALVARWMSVGFVHGVMNTDNVTVSGETIDYGPCAFLDAYSAAQVFSSIDTGGRYAFGNQPVVCRWNMYRLASALIEAIVAADEADGEKARELLAGFEARFERHWIDALRPKLGLSGAEDGDLALAKGLFAAIEGQGADFTRLFRTLARSLGEGYGAVAAELTDPAALEAWHGEWLARLARDSGDAAGRAARMDGVNPLYIARNHLTDAALAAAEAGDLAPFDELLALVSDPFRPRAGMERYEHGAPQGSPAHVTYCGT